MSPSSLTTRLPTVEETVAWGRRLALELQAGDVVALAGQLGAGKTQATKGITAGLGSPAVVSSPTFTLVHEYPGGRLPVYHFDFYRLQSSGEVLRIGWDDYLDAAGVIIVEWADRFPEILPGNARWFFFELEKEGGRVVEERRPPPEPIDSLDPTPSPP